VPLSDKAAIPAVAGIAAGVCLIIIFSIMLQTPKKLENNPRVSLVTIPQEASAPGGEGFVPKVIKVVIGTNNTVKWINRDSIPNSVYADNEDDPLFYNATRDQCKNNDYNNCEVILGKNILMPGGTFEFTFTKPGEFHYHSVPHPQMKGTVIVLPESEK